MECMTSLGSLLQCYLQYLGIPRESGVKDEIQKQNAKDSLQGDRQASDWGLSGAGVKHRLDQLTVGLEGKLRGLPNANPQWHLGVRSQNGLQIGAT